MSEVTIEIPEEHRMAFYERVGVEFVYAGEHLTAIGERFDRDGASLEDARAPVRRIEILMGALEQLAAGATGVTIDAGIADVLLGHSRDYVRDLVGDRRGEFAEIRPWVDFGEWVDGQMDRLAEHMEAAV